MEISRLLIATNDERKRLFFNETLGNGRYDLFFAFSPEETFNLIVSHQGGFDLLLLDFSFRENGGERCLKELKSHPLFKRIPVMGIFSKEHLESILDFDSNLDDILISGMKAGVVKKKISRLLNAISLENNGRRDLVELKDQASSDSSKYLFNITSIPKEVLSKFNLLSFFDAYRIVDIETRFIHHFDESGKLVKEDIHCYETWKRTIPCVNCISQSCLARKEEFIKVEHFQAKTFIIAALPLEIDNHNYSIEFVKDATSELLLADHNSNTNLSMNAYLKHMTDLSGRDLFSGLHNKTYINQSLTNLLTAKEEVEVAFIDIDGFKQVNDNYGHLLGDEVIFFLSSLLSSLEDKYKFVSGRVGGDEFLVYSKKGQGLNEYLNKAILEFESHVFSRDSEEFKLSVSAGYTFSKPGDSLDTLLARVDDQMYLIKQSKHKKETKKK